MPPKKIEKDKNQHIQVVVRCRPLNGLEKKQGSYNIVDPIPDRREVHVKERATLSAPSKTYTFDRVFGPQAKQIELYRTTVVPIIEEVLLGYNCTIFAYGQTGTGKTFTMEGEKTDDPSVCWENDPLSGIIPRAMSQLFSRLDKMNCEYTIRVSFLEIYNEELIDLLGADSVENPRLKIYEDVAKKGSHVIQGLEDVVVLNKDAVYNILERGTQRRQTAATMMNAHSSRSHSVFMVTIHMRENSVEGEELLKTGKLNLVDLAGSECIGKSGAVEKRAREAGNINQSLLTLGRVITALVEHAPHIPYRESKLTRLLQDSLGGRTKTSIIATISPASSNIEETLSTLDYAHRAKNITNRPEINQKLTKKALLKEYTEEMERLRRDLQAARDKNGFYIAEENYNAMHTQILQQKDHIKDIEGKMDVLGSEMYKLNEMFTETKEELEETTKQLETTSKTLEETTETLGKTRGNLCRTRQDRDEQKHIVMQQVKTETKLHGQASQLMYTADTATSDVSGLHAKLDRKKAVETHNENAQETFRVHFRESVDDMETGLKSFTETQLQTISDMDNNIGCMLDKRIGEVKGITQDISGVVTMVTDQLAAINKSQTENKEKTQAWSQELVASCKETRDKEVCRQFEFYEQTFQTAISSVSSALTQLSGDLDKLQESLHTQRQKQQENIQTFADKQVSSLDRQKELVAEYTKVQEASIEQHRQKNRDIFTSQQRNNQATTDQFLEGVQKLMTDMLEAQKCHLSQNIDQMDRDLLSSQTKTSDFHENVNRHINECTEVVQGYKTQLQEETTVQDAESRRNIDELQSTVEQITESNKSLEKEVGSHSDISREVCLTGSDKIIKMVEQQLGESKTQLEAHNTSTQALSLSCSSALNDMNNKQASQQAELETSLEAQKTLLDAQRNVGLAWSENHHEALENRDREVETFLTDEINKDLPTGTTPQRREFSYPHNLVRTNRHSEIIQEFRRTYLLEEAMNVPIPDDSFPSMSSIPQMVLDDMEDPESVDDTRTTGDPESEVHNLSEDSAFGTNSSTVSDGDKIQRCESKENLMRPPNAIPTKSRTGSSRSTSCKSKTGTKTPTQVTPTKNKANTTPGQGSSKLPSRLPLRPANNH